MKRYKYSIYIVFIILSALLFPSCNDFLEREPKDSFTDDNYWANENQVRTYAWLFYDKFMGYGNGTGTTADFYFQTNSTTLSMLISDDLVSNLFLQYQANANSANTDWKEYYEQILRANLMLLRIPDVPMDSEAAGHWEGVARFFRAFSYFRLVQQFGGVPYNDYVLTDDKGVEKIYRTRMDRIELMDKALDDLNIALTKLRSKSEESNAINQDVALAFKSRFALYEGTYRNYHQLGDGTAYLQEARSAALELIESGRYSLNAGAAGFRAVYNSEALNGNPEMILYKEYALGVLANSVQAYTNTSTIGYGMTKAAIESYVCVDGLPIEQSSLYEGDKSIDNIMANRDPRLLEAIDDEGISFRGFDKSLSRSRKSSTGYVLQLYYNVNSIAVTTTGQNTIDAPVFTYPEVLLNYAEACAELGSLTQNDLDRSVNLLRSRVGITPLTYVSDDDVRVNGITINDPKRTAALEQISGVVPSIIWEIRRERRAELMTWTILRYYDLMRWKKGDYLDYLNNPDVALGAYVEESTLTPDDEVVLNDEGYIRAYPENTRIFNPEKHYLNAIPSSQIELYKAEGIELTQNPGW